MQNLCACKLDLDAAGAHCKKKHGPVVQVVKLLLTVLSERSKLQGQTVHVAKKLLIKETEKNDE